MVKVKSFVSQHHLEVLFNAFITSHLDSSGASYADPNQSALPTAGGPKCTSGKLKENKINTFLGAS